MNLIYSKRANVLYLGCKRINLDACNCVAVSILDARLNVFCIYPSE